MLKPIDEMFARYVRTRDADALAFVFEQTAPGLARRARRLLGDARAAEDLVQDLFLSLIAGAVAWDPSRPCRPWLVGALHRRAARWHRNGGKWPLDPLPNGRHGGERSPEEHASDRELRAAVLAAMVWLPAASRDVVHRYVELHETPQEIGRALGRAPGTVRVQLHRGLHALRGRLPLGFLTLALAMMVRPAPASPPPAPRPLLHSARAWLGIAAAMLVLVAGVRVTSPPAARIAANVVATTGAGGGDGAVTDSAPASTLRVAVETDVPSPRGRFVLRHADGSPASGIGVMFGRAGTDPDFGWQRAVSDAQGAVAIAGVAAGEVELTTDRGARASFVLRSGANDDLTVDLSAGVDVAGRVLDANGNAVAQAGIWVAHEPRQPWDGQCAVFTDADGGFVLRGMPPLSTFAARAPGREPSPLQVVGMKARADVVLRIGGAGATVAGQVRALDGSPVAGAVVRIGRHVRARFVQFDGTLPAASVSTGSDGRFVCGGLPDGRLEISVRRAGFAAALQPVQLGSGGSREIEVRLRPGRDLRGVVRGVDGKPVPLAQVTAHGLAQHEWSGVFTAADGSFELVGVAAERALLEVKADGFVTHERPLHAPLPAVVDVVLPRVPARRARLVTAGGELARTEDWEVGCRTGELTWDRRSPVPLPFAADGSFEASPDAQAAYFCRPRGTAVWLPCTAGTAGGCDLHVVVPGAAADCTLAVRLVGFTPAQLADAVVMLVRSDEAYVLRDRPADGGGVVSACVPAGGYEVFVMGACGACPACPGGVVTVQGDTLHDVRVPPSGVLRYEPRAGHRVERWHAFVIHESGMQAPLRQPAGSVALAAGCYTLWASGPSFMTVRGVPFEVRAGQETLLEVPVRAGVVRHVAFELPPGARGETAVATLRSDGELVLGGEPGLRDRGFDVPAHGHCRATIVLADGAYDLELRDGRQRWIGRFAVGGEDGAIEPLVVPLREAPR